MVHLHQSLADKSTTRNRFMISRCSPIPNLLQEVPWNTSVIKHSLVQRLNWQSRVSGDRRDGVSNSRLVDMGVQAQTGIRSKSDRDSGKTSRSPLEMPQSQRAASLRGLLRAAVGPGAWVPIRRTVSESSRKGYNPPPFLTVPPWAVPRSRPRRPARP